MAQKFFTYKGRPLVRKGNTIYYGHMYEDAVAMLTVQSSHKYKDVELADSIQVQLISTDPSVPPQKMVLKHSMRKDLFDALDIAAIWINRTIKES